MLEIKNVTKVYKSKNIEYKALDNINLVLKDKKFTSILGKSGSGKTTLLNIIGMLDNEYQGSIVIDEILYKDLSEDEAASFRNNKFGYIFQAFYLEDTFTVYDNIKLPLMIKNVSKDIIEDKIINILKEFGLEEYKDKKVGLLSGGEKQRVCVARAIINDASIILADEPTGSLDSENGEIVLLNLKKLVNLGKTVILVTHNEEDAYKYSDEIIRIKDGRIIKHEIIK